jgi:hypothetical protein
MKISYAVTVCNEFVEIQRLVTQLLKTKRPQDNIVVLYDEANGDPEIENYLRSHSINREFAWHKGKFAGDFAAWKNQLKSLCTGDYVVFLDADEMVTDYFMRILPDALSINVQPDMIRVPRINRVNGITEEHVAKWGWRVDVHNRINYPDYQTRICKNIPEITWTGRVHETLTGFQFEANLPADIEDFALIHVKDIAKQELQNNFYETL